MVSNPSSVPWMIFLLRSEGATASGFSLQGMQIFGIMLANAAHQCRDGTRWCRNHGLSFNKRNGLLYTGQSF